MKNLVLCGYMGCGKTAVGQLLAVRSGRRFIDLDERIEAAAGMDIPSIFERDGEVFFRKLEHRILEEVIARESGFVLALGGGTPAYANNHLLLNAEGVESFFLRASVATLARRLAAETHKRPLLQGKVGEELEEYIAKHLFDRSYYYHQAMHTVSVDGKSVEEITAGILSISA